jgi:outer membrane exchange protein TraA
MLVRRLPSAFLAVAAAAVSLALAGTVSAAPVIVPTSTADALMGAGQGLCVANAISMNPSTDFPQQAGVFIAGINGFLEAPAQLAARVQYVQQSIFDLSNNQDTGPKVSWGDFTNAMLPQCQEGGCPFNWNDTTTSFASRFRGFLNVTAALAAKPIHIGVYVDDAMSLTFYDKMGNAYPVMIQPPVLGAPTWRLTETVTFMEQGLYPLELLYVQIVDHAALEMSYFTGTFTDFQQTATQVPVTPLNTAGFTLFPVTDFFQTLSGSPSYPDVAQCKQCNREFVGQFGNNGCDSAYYCNEAALCAPCDTSIYCGPSCSPCGGMTPFCIDINSQLQCGQCRTDTDCKAGFSCDPTTHVCNQCNVDSDCTKGHECVDHACVWCSTSDKCAGNSCNCCPPGESGKQMQCVVLPRTDPTAAEGCPPLPGEDPASQAPECAECLTDSDCPSGYVCDQPIGLCLESSLKSEIVPPAGQPDCCGPQCLACPVPPAEDWPWQCLPGPFGTACAACRNDMECCDGNFCTEGQCQACVSDRRCGPRCNTCGGDTPYCLTAQLASDAVCVRCNEDAECNGGTCDTTTHACTSACAMTCAPATPYCDGKDCVACYANTQCPCGGTCDLGTHTCSTACNTNADCQGDQHCGDVDNGTSMACTTGPLPNDADCGGTLADLCSGSIGARGSHPTPSTGIFGLSLVALFLRRLRRKSGAPS